MHPFRRLLRPDVMQFGLLPVQVIYPELHLRQRLLRRYEMWVGRRLPVPKRWLQLHLLQRLLRLDVMRFGRYLQVPGTWLHLLIIQRMLRIQLLPVIWVLQQRQQLLLPGAVMQERSLQLLGIQRVLRLALLPRRHLLPNQRRRQLRVVQRVLRQQALQQWWLCGSLQPVPQPVLHSLPFP